MNNRHKMYQSNQKARVYLQVMGCSDIWFKAHTRRNDRTYTQNSYYLSTDLFNLFDGVALLGNSIIFFQVKSNRWPSPKPMYVFAKQYQGVCIMAINVRSCKTKRNKANKKDVRSRVY